MSREALDLIDRLQGEAQKYAEGWSKSMDEHLETERKLTASYRETTEVCRKLIALGKEFERIRTMKTEEFLMKYGSFSVN